MGKTWRASDSSKRRLRPKGVVTLGAVGAPAEISGRGGIQTDTKPCNMAARSAPATAQS